MRIHRLELSPADRSDAIPPDTRSVAFEAWMNGWVERDASPGEDVEIRTVTGRLVKGRLVDTQPSYVHSFGSPPRPLQLAAAHAIALLRGPGTP